MPNLVADFVPWRVLLLVHNKLADIGLHGGYNTQPLVTMDYEEFRQASVDCALLVLCGDLNIVENDIGDGSTGATRTQPEIVLTVHGSVKTKAGNQQAALMALLQDVLTALSLKPNELREETGRGITMRISNARLMTINLTGEREAAFTLEAVFRYSQGSTW